MKKGIICIILTIMAASCSKEAYNPSEQFSNNDMILTNQTAEFLVPSEPIICVGENILKNVNIFLYEIVNDTLHECVDVTKYIEWTTDNTAVATAPGDEIETHNEGKATLTATYGQHTVKIDVNVSDQKSIKSKKHIGITFTNTFLKNNFLYTYWYSSQPLKHDLNITLSWSVNTDDTVDCIPLEKGKRFGIIKCFPEDTGIPKNCYKNQKPDNAFFIGEKSFENTNCITEYLLL